MKFSPLITAALMAIAPSMVDSKNQLVRDLKGKKSGKGGGRGSDSAPSCNQAELAVVVIFDDLDDSGGIGRKLGSSYGGYGSGGYGDSHDINDFSYNGVVLCYDDVSNYNRWSEDESELNAWIAGGYGRPSSIIRVGSTTTESFGGSFGSDDDECESCGDDFYEVSQVVFTTTDLVGHRIAIPPVYHHGQPDLCDIAQGEYGLHGSDHSLFATQLTASGVSVVIPMRKRKLQNNGVTVAQGVTSTVGSLAGYLNGASKANVNIGGLGFDVNPEDISDCFGSVSVWELPYTREAVQALNQVQGTVYQSYS